MVDDSLCTVSKQVTLVDVATGSIRKEKVLTVKGKSLKECKKVFDEEWLKD